MHDVHTLLNHTEAKLDRNFDQRGCGADAEEIIAGNVQHRARTKLMLEIHANIPYGDPRTSAQHIFRKSLSWRSRRPGVET
jgi:hypothetical protein